MLQFLVNGLISGILYSFTAIGFALVYNTTRVFHMAAASLYAAAAYFLYAFNIHLGLLPSFLIAVTLTSILSLLVEWTVYRPLYHKKALAGSSRSGPHKFYRPISTATVQIP